MTLNGVDVGSSAFRNCDNLSQVTLVSASVYESAFAECDNLEKVEMGAYTVIGSGAFFSCSKLEEVTLSTETVGMGAQCFADCSSLKKIYNLGWATNVSVIGSEFLRGVNLENNTIAANVWAIESNALSGCNMPEWNLPNISIAGLHLKNRFGAPNGTIFNCADGTDYI